MLLSMGRVEAFSDGVIAVIITIMVLDLKVPGDTTFAALMGTAPALLTYVLSFVVVAMMWINHHHLLHNAKRPDAQLMWANMFLLFWMSLVPLCTRYLSDTHAAPLSVAAYSADLMLTSVGFYWLMHVVGCHNSDDTTLATRYRRQIEKTWLSIGAYGAAVPLAFASPRIALAILVLIPLLYFLPDRRLIQP
jgi:uncharacterized membrane protein